MKERPILFTPENAQKSHVGTKTQTRRVIKPQPDDAGAVLGFRDIFEEPGVWLYNGQTFKCPYGVVGDRLWVREKHWRCELEGCGIGNGFLVYDDEFQDREPKPRERRLFPGEKFGPLPSIHMPRWACRTVLEITAIRVERLGAITEADAQAEGVKNVAEFIGLWKPINKTWEPSLWVWVICFRSLAL